MIFLKHVQHKLGNRDELESIHAHVRKTAAEVPGVRLRYFFILQDHDEFILVMECPDEKAYQEWYDLCPPPPGASAREELAVLAEDFGKSPN